MVILNILNLEKIIFFNKNIQNYLIINHEKFYNEWQNLVYTNNKSEKFRFYIETLNRMESGQLILDIADKDKAKAQQVISDHKGLDIIDPAIATKASAVAKLAALGLTADEAKLILG